MTITGHPSSDNPQSRMFSACMPHVVTPNLRGKLLAGMAMVLATPASHDRSGGMRQGRVRPGLRRRARSCTGTCHCSSGGSFAIRQPADDNCEGFRPPNWPHVANRETDPKMPLPLSSADDTLCTPVAGQIPNERRDDARTAKLLLGPG